MFRVGYLIAFATVASAYYVPMQPAVNPEFSGFHVIVPLQPQGFRHPSPYSFEPHGFHHQPDHYHHVHQTYSYPPPTTTTTTTEAPKTTIEPQVSSSGIAEFVNTVSGGGSDTFTGVDEGTNTGVQTEKTPEIIYKPNYEFEYKVNEKSTGDIKHHREKAVEGFVSGQYSLVEPDGLSKRVVDYTADDINGFQANVRREPYVEQ